MDITGFSARLKELIGPNSANAFAREVGISESLIRKYLAGGMPGIEKAAQIALIKNVSLDWLIAGEGEREPRQAKLPANVDEGFAMIRRLSVHASAGNGALAEREDDVGTLAFRAEWLHRRGINPTAARALTARGDSMEPTIRDGDILLVDTSIDHIIDHAIYVVVVSGLVLVKRAQLRLDGSLRLASDNPVFTPEDIPANETDQVQIAGRVMWFGRSI
ncbi:helix-turn-helix transcriptional regulator [Breoghania sp.]|uniref:LexA family transcriptional regulator n=1 Tax=Breoghania sp. TaxID=2065378 RepID=UPI0029CA549D|nr:helix-turn-helix transcriptional regulator [Breoghania sp.]